jgi:RNA polymerase sigma-70 factor (ECF subfamily)
MLKIVTRRSSTGQTLCLEGELIGPWVDELARTAQTAAGVLTIDLADVAFADRDGVRLLQTLGQDHVRLVNVSPFLAERLKTHVDDADLVDRLRRGDVAALDTLMARFAGKAFRIAFGITRNAADAEEVVSDVFATIVRKADTFQGRSALSTWIHRITTNAALNKRRGKRHEVEVPLDADLPTYTADGHRAGDRAFLCADWSQRPDEVLRSKEVRARLDAALGRLPAAYRTVVVLRDVEGLSSEEVAEVIGESVAAVKSRLHRARMALREQMSSYFFMGGLEGPPMPPALGHAAAEPRRASGSRSTVHS